MNSEQFNGLMSRMRNCFGEKHYNTIRLERIFRVCRHLDMEQLDRLVDEFVDYSRTPPLPGDFLLAMRKHGWLNREQKYPDYMGKYLRCGHEFHSSWSRNLHGACKACLQEGYIPEVIKYPYLTQFIPRELHEEAAFFQRQGQEDIQAYTRRTWARLRDVQDSYGLITRNVKESIMSPIKAVMNAAAGGPAIEERKTARESNL